MIRTGEIPVRQNREKREPDEPFVTQSEIPQPVSGKPHNSQRMAEATKVLFLLERIIKTAAVQHSQHNRYTEQDN